MSRLSTRKVHGRVLSLELEPPPKPHDEKKILWSVRLGNLHVDTTEDELRTSLQGTSPKSIMFGKKTTKISAQAAVGLVKAKLTESGRELRSFEAVHTPTGAQMRAYVSFADRSQAKSALSLAGQLVPEIGSKLHLELRATVRISLLHDIYHALKKEIDSLSENVKQTGVWISSPPLVRHAKVTIRIVGNDPVAVAKAKTKLEGLMAGRVVLNDRNGALWDHHYRSSIGFAELQSHHAPGELFLYRDLQKEHVVFYGKSALYSKVREALKANMVQRGHFMHFIPLDVDSSQRESLNYLKVRLQKKFGQDRVSLGIARASPYIFLSGSEDEVQLAKEMMSTDLSQDKLRGGSEPSENCPVCFEAPEEAIKLSCGHRYCSDCFQAQCKAADATQFPIVCFGAAGNCKKVISLHDLGRVLPYGPFEALLECSIEMHARSQPGKFQHCPTADCSNIYPVTTDGTVMICEQCLTSICTSCRTIHHDGLDCEEAKRIEAARQEEVYMQHYREENDARKCPRCPATIERVDGCNHVACSNCHAHICWNRDCMEAFDTARQCYGHLETVHGTFVDVPEVLDDEQMLDHQAALLVEALGIIIVR